MLATQTLPQAAPEDDGGRGRRRAAAGRDGQGRHPRRSSARSASAAASATSIEYRGEAIRALSMEGRMTVCNMSIEGGARAGMVAPDDTTFAYLEGPPARAEGRGLGARRRRLARAADRRRARRFDRRRSLSTPRTWSRTSPGAPTPGMVVPVTGRVPDPDAFADAATRAAPSARSSTWASRPGTPIEDIAIDRVFIGSCTNARIEDLRAAAAVVRGQAGRARACARWSCRARGW